ncbi:MAG: restriction endonuclease subunit S [Paludibacter sp.]|jgi:type I restriction enzyme S subunit|nr:restriction endonuclease subunit S [Paludibacter sp.]
MSEWIKDEIGNHIKTYAGGTPNRAIDAYFNGDIPWISSGEVNQSYIDKTKEHISLAGLESSSAKWIPSGAVLLAMYGATAGQVAKLKITATANQAVLALIPDETYIDKDYLFHILDFEKERILYLAQGSGQPNLSKGLIDNYKISFPKNVDQQKKISLVLDTCDTVIEQTQAAIEKYKAIKQGMLHDLFTRGLTASGQLRPTPQQAPELYKQSELGLIPKEWEVKISDSIVRYINGRAYSIHEWETTGTPVIRLQNLTGSGETYYYSTLKLPEDQYCNKGDLLYMWSASFGPHIWNGDKAIYHYHIWKVECSKGMLQDYFYYNLLRFTDTVLNGANGSTMAHITKEKMDKRLVLTPPIQEQSEITSRIHSIDTKLQSEESLLSKYQSIKKGLMSDLLSGKRGV